MTDFGGMCQSDFETLAKFATSYGVANTLDALAHICNINRLRVAANNSARPLSAIMDDNAKANLHYWVVAVEEVSSAAVAVRHAS